MRTIQILTVSSCYFFSSYTHTILFSNVSSPHEAFPNSPRQKCRPMLFWAATWKQTYCSRNWSKHTPPDPCSAQGQKSGGGSRRSKQVSQSSNKRTPDKRPCCTITWVEIAALKEAGWWTGTILGMVSWVGGAEARMWLTHLTLPLTISPPRTRTPSESLAPLSCQQRWRQIWERVWHSLKSAQVYFTLGTHLKILCFHNAKWNFVVTQRTVPDQEIKP